MRKREIKAFKKSGWLEKCVEEEIEEDQRQLGKEKP